MAVYQLTVQRLNRSLADFIRLLEPGLPWTNTMRMAAKRVQNGKITANFYTDGWPVFSTVVCQVIKPRLSDEADLLCYSTSKEGLLYVMKEAELVTWGKWQTIGMAETSHAGYLVENLKPPDLNEPGLEGHFSGLDVKCYLPRKLHGEDRSCSQGFVLGKLEPQHLDYVVSQWNHEMREKSKHHLSYFDHMIRHCASTAIFQADDPTKPVSWVMQYPYGQLGHAFTHEKYRMKGFLTPTTRNVSKQIIADGDLPELVTFDNAYSTVVKNHWGFISMYKTVCLEVKRKGF